MIITVLKVEIYPFVYFGGLRKDLLLFKLFILVFVLILYLDDMFDVLKKIMVAMHKCDFPRFF